MEEADLRPLDESGPAGFGWAVALSANGDTALIGAPINSGRTGAAWVFTRVGSRWREQGRPLTARGEDGGAEFGFAVALSDDGNTALIGGPDDDGSAGATGSTDYGAAWVFTRTDAVWAQHGGKLIGGGETPTALFGAVVALSGNGRTALIGAFNAFHRGAAWIFKASRRTWRQEAQLPFPHDDKSAIPEFGGAIALSVNGRMAVASDPDYIRNQGAVWTFVEHGNRWAVAGRMLTASDERGRAAFGIRVALASSGNVLLVSGMQDRKNIGAAWRYVRQGTDWIETRKVTPPQNAPTSTRYFGVGLALSRDGRIALIGTPVAGISGAAWIYR